MRTSATLTLAQLGELLYATEFVSWENKDFTSAVAELERAKEHLEAAVESRDQP